MNMILTFIKDTATEAAGPIMAFVNERQAVRALSDAANDPASNISKHPEDYHMYKCGMYDDQSGEVQGMTHVQIARAQDLVKVQS